MIGRLAHAAGSPCPTLVLDSRYLPGDDEPLLAALTEARAFLADAGGGHVLKIALVEPSNHPLFDLDYRFVQALPPGPGRFDLRGSCGHSVLSAVVAAADAGILPPLAAGTRIRVNVLNNGDHLVCEVDRTSRDAGVEFTMHFLHTPPKPCSRLLLDGRPQTALSLDGRDVPVSLVGSGNPYVFVAAASVGVRSTQALFADDPVLFDRLVRLRAVAARHLGWPTGGAFPKVAVVMPAAPGRIAVRAVSVPSWHPTLALTGAACLGSAAAIADTLPWHAARDAGCAPDLLRIDTPGGHTTVAVATRVRAGEPHLDWVSIGGKRVSFHGSFFCPALAHLQFKEITACLSLPT